MTPAADAAVRLFRDARAAAAKVERRAVARRIAIAAAAAVRRAPVYGADLRRAVPCRSPREIATSDAGAFGAGPFAAAPALLSAVKRPTTRATESKDLIATFMFAIPKARAPPPTMTCSAPCASIRTAEARDKSWSQKVGWPALAPLRQASVRQQLFFPDRRLVQFDCGKLQALAQLLRTLKSGGHKVLIFTQMTKMLDILEAFLNLYGYPYCRLDGSTRPEQRQILMQRFNTDPRLFVFILSTRSGGFGINLTGADTVVFYDSDWNPAMDQQAQDRAHRIGQTREVHIYRLVCKGTIEENILKKSMQKRELDHFAIQAGNFNTEHFKKMSAAGGGDAEGSGDENRQRGDVVGGQQGAAAMSIFDRAMSRAAAPAKDSDAGGEGEGARKGTGATAKGAGAEDDDEVGRLMDEAQDDVDKAAAAATAREDADEAAEFGDDIKETADPDAETDDAKLARAKSRRVSARVRGGGGEPPSTPADAGAGASRPANDGELAMVPINTSLEGDDQFAQDMMRKVQMSASKGESLEQQLRPVERYAVRYLEETVRIMDDVDATRDGHRRFRGEGVGIGTDGETESGGGGGGGGRRTHHRGVGDGGRDGRVPQEGGAGAAGGGARGGTRTTGARTMGGDVRDALGGGGGGGNHTGAGGGGGGGRRIESGRVRRSVRGEGASSIAEREPARPARAARARRFASNFGSEAQRGPVHARSRDGGRPHRC